MAKVPYLEMEPLSRPAPLRHQVEAALRGLIVSGPLEPGQHLVESGIAERLGVSRGPVREALQALDTQGWVELRQGRGAFVHEPTVAEVDEVFGVRAALESEAGTLAADNVRASDVDELRKISGHGREAVREGAYDVAVATNSEFHRRVADLSRNRLLGRLIASLDDRIRWYLRPVVRGRGETSWDEHDAMISALAEHDATRVAALMRHHTDQTRRANVGGREDAT
ncbi:MAG: GntR family transcriptional regulator [Streptosporangiales bacterium]|nr:GntR family transcriptional regulator [Streptosporangiales bacterium]